MFPKSKPATVQAHDQVVAAGRRAAARFVQGPTAVESARAATSKISLNDFVKSVQGKIIGSGRYRGQCTQITQLWERENGWPVVHGNAKDTLAAAPASDYVKTHNGPTNYPAPGSILVWGKKFGHGFGHTAVVISANEHTVTVVEQNFGDHGLTHVQTHSYVGVEGWFTHR